jgi:hypothetical protein
MSNLDSHDEWPRLPDEAGDFEDEDTLEFVITSADEEEETTWEWDGSDWKRVN